ncbi:MAG: phosphoribosylformylglycinamidine synthase subunit PurL [Helicobacteraceae bacterium]|nr:phosphoribosylformylglycinamidine synthase subunit PurL [Helicobacteraceae bacterium]
MQNQIQNINEVLKNHKLSTQDYENIKKILNREPNLVEIGIFSAMWSEHCSYKSSKIYLKNFPTKAPYVVQGPGENAGVIDIGEGYCAVFKMESHNHPSFIEPYAGAATGVGGILRDIFTMGARPIANLNSLRFGNIKDGKEKDRHKYLLKRVVAGIGDYGNCMGIPTIGGETSFESCYNGNILVNAFSLGIVKKENIFYGRAKGVKNSIIYVGSKTGRDGLGGAVMSSDSFNEDSASLKPTVQVGDPFSEKLLLEACLELFSKDLIVGIQDMGAAGLTSSSFEMASRAGSGMRLYLDKVPMREPNMTPYELMLSESQERMLLCAKSGKEQEIIDIFNKWEVDVAIIGEVTDNGNMELFFDNELCAEIPIAPLSDSAPVLNREIQYPKYLDELKSLPAININKTKNNNEIFRELLGSLEICDKSFIYNQYDSTILANTIVGAGNGDASVIRIKENGAKLAMSLYCNPRYCYLNPKEGAKIAVAISGRNCATRGAIPLAITDCLNFGSPQNKEVMWQFKETCEGIKEACEILSTPVVSGNVSLYNQTNDIDIYPTPSIGMVGIIGKENKVLDSAFKNKGNLIILLGDLGEDFGGSLLFKLVYNSISGEIPHINLDKELNLWKVLQDSSSFVKSAKSIKDGGIAITLAKMALLGGYGINIVTNAESLLFAESQSCSCIEIKEESLKTLENIAKKYNVSYKILGQVEDKNGDINIDSISIKQNIARELYFDTLANFIKG